MKYRSIVPPTVEAVQWDGVVLVGGKPDWLPTPVTDRKCDVPTNTCDRGEIVEQGDTLLVGTVFGTQRAGPGDWLVNGPDTLTVIPAEEFGEKYRLDMGDEDFARDEGDLLGGPEPAPETVACGFGQDASDYEVGYKRGFENGQELTYDRRLAFDLASRGCDGWALEQVFERAEKILAWVRRPVPEVEPAPERKVDAFGHPHGTVFIPPVGDGLVEHPPAEPPAPVAGDARSEESLRTTEELSSGNAHG